MIDAGGVRAGAGSGCVIDVGGVRAGEWAAMGSTWTRDVTQHEKADAGKEASAAVVVLSGLVLAVLACAISAGLGKLGLLESTELRGYDLLVTTRDCTPSPEIVVVDLDNASVEQLNAFPIPRGLLNTIVGRISSGAPELIGLDVLLDMPRDEVEDSVLAQTIWNAGNVIIAEVFGSEGLPSSTPLPLFRQAALDVAFANMPLDRDGFVRRTLLYMRDSDYQGLSLPIVLASNYWYQPLEPAGPGMYRLGTSTIRTDESAPNSSLIAAWCPPTTVSVLELLESSFDVGIFTGKIVLVGQSSSAAKDLYPTPLFRYREGPEGRVLTSGTEVHAAALATVLEGRTVRVLGTPLLWALNLLLAWLAAAAVVRARPTLGVLAVLGLGAATAVVAHLLMSQQGVWMSFASTELGIALTLPGGLGFRFLRERRLKSDIEAERGQLMEIFERYVSPEVAAEIWERRDEIVLEGHQRDATVVFSDIRSFTSLTAGRPSEEVLTWLNEYFDVMSQVIKRHGGMLNKFIGDGMLVVFGVPLSEGEEEDARRAVRASVEMLRRVEELNAARGADRPECAIGIGLHSGTLTAGNVGARDRLEYSVVGETVNMASRLEALTKDFETSIVMSPHTRDLIAGEFETLPLGEVSVRGFPDKIHIYTLDEGTSPEVEQ